MCKRLARSFAKAGLGVPSWRGADRHRRRRHQDRRDPAGARGADRASAGRHPDRIRRGAGCDQLAGEGARRAGVGWRGHGRGRNPRFSAAGRRGDPELEPALPERPAARRGSRGGARAPGAAGQRRQVLRALRGDRWRGCPTEHARPRAPRRRLRSDAGDGGRWWDRRRRARLDGRKRRRHRVEPHHPSLYRPRRAVPLPLRLRPPRLYRVVHLGPRPRGDLPGARGGGFCAGTSWPRAPSAATARRRKPSGSTRTGWRGRWRRSSTCSTRG